jgi:hypothetical protein
MRAACCLALAACSSTGPGPNAVALTVVGSPALIAYRDGGGDFLTPAKTSSEGGYQLGVTYDYELYVTCSDAAGFDTVIRARTTDDGDQFIYCDGHATALPASVAVTGQMAQPGIVSAYDIAQSATGPWAFTLAVPAGTRDLVATSGDSVAIRRDLAITTDTELPALDVAAEGARLVPVQLAVNIASGDQLTSEIDLYSANNIAWGPTVEGATAQTIPASLLRADDEVDIYLEDWTPPGAGAVGYFRTLDAVYDSSTASFELMPLLTQVFFDNTGGVTWGDLPEHTGVSLTLFANGSSQHVSASQTWLANHGTSTLGLDAFGPLPAHFQPTWRIDLTQPYSQLFEALDDGASTGIEQDPSSLQGRQAQDLPVHVATRRIDRRIEKQARDRGIAQAR